ncbi:cytochrome c4 [human gut metagenome]|uniref:Cytochrome c4 n=1 Tax=human gut metagenome TaxID=408170 RepID=K1RTK4_9ZZZZ
MKSYLEQAFGRGDVTSARMQAAIREWLNLYYGTQSPGEDAADRLAVLVVSKLCRTVFAEYESRTAEALAPSLQALDAVRVQAMQYALVGGECLLKPVLHGRGFDFVPIRRDCYAPLGRDAHGALTGVGTMCRNRFCFICSHINVFVICKRHTIINYFCRSISTLLYSFFA